MQVVLRANSVTTYNQAGQIVRVVYDLPEHILMRIAQHWASQFDSCIVVD